MSVPVMSPEVQIDCFLDRVETPLAASDLKLPAEVWRVEVDWLEISNVSVEAGSWKKNRNLDTKYFS